MPTNVVSIENMHVGKKGGGKHWTKAEIERRRQAAEGLKRKKAKPPKAPEYIKNDPEAFAIWKRIIRDTKDLDLLDSLDAETLATYCALEVSKQKALAAGDYKIFEGLAKTALQYAKSLGLTPEARARLAKKRADAAEADPNADLFE